MKNSENIFFNVLENVPDAVKKEVIEELFCDENLSIERITSKGQVSSDNFWYDQKKNEFVIVLQGKGIILFDDGRV